MIKNNMVNIGNRTLCCPIQSVIIWVINKIRLLLRNRSILLIARMITDRIGPLSVILSSWIPFKQVISPFILIPELGHTITPYSSITAEENQTLTKTVIDAVLADHGGDKCPWSAAELRGTLTATHGFIIAALV